MNLTVPGLKSSTHGMFGFSASLDLVVFRMPAIRYAAARRPETTHTAMFIVSSLHGSEERIGSMASSPTELHAS